MAATDNCAILPAAVLQRLREAIGDTAMDSRLNDAAARLWHPWLRINRAQMYLRSRRGPASMCPSG
jgi:hypothetical protein